VAVHLTRRELDVMSVLWKRGSATVAEARDGIADDLAYPTVLTVLRTLEAKGHVRHEQVGKGFRYIPLLQSDAAGTSAMDRLLDKVYHGSREMLVAGLLADESIDEAELRRLRKLVNDRLKEAKK